MVFEAMESVWPISRFSLRILCLIFQRSTRAHNFAEIITFGLWLKIKVNRNLVFISVCHTKHCLHEKRHPRAHAHTRTTGHTHTKRYFYQLFNHFYRFRGKIALKPTAPSTTNMFNF